MVLDSDFKVDLILELDWNLFMQNKRWHSRMSAWNLTITNKLIDDAKIIFKA